MYRHLGWALAFLTAGCGESGSDAGSLPPDAEALKTYLKAGVTLIMPRLGGAGAVFPFALSPGSPGATGITFNPDPTPGAPPNSYVFALDLDGDGDGSAETTFSGSAAFNGDPANAGDGFSGHVVLTMQSAGGLGTLTGDMDFVLTPAGGEISGSGSFSEVITGNTTTLTVAPANPLLIQMAKGTANSMANACASSLNGDLQLDVDGPTGTLTSTWGFQNTRTTARVTGASFTNTNNETTDIPDESVTIPCGQKGKLKDWTGNYLQNWACLPPEFGQASLTLAVSGANTISITDEDPPGSGDIAVYQATSAAGNPHVVRGFFIAGPAGNTYREDFSWILAGNGNSFSDISSYVYLEGPNQGGGGLCGGTATRQP